MTAQSDVNAMGDILRKLENSLESPDVEGSQAPPRTIGDPDIAAMTDILSRLNEATAQVVTEQAPNDVELQMAITTKPTENGVTISRYDIRTEKQNVTEGLRKTMYQIIDNRNAKVIYDELCLFESAMGIVKNLMAKQPGKIERIMDLDRRYLGHMIESYSHKRKLGTLMEGTSTHNVSSAKYTMSMDRLAEVKLKLLKAL